MHTAAGATSQYSTNGISTIELQVVHYRQAQHQLTLVTPSQLLRDMPFVTMQPHMGGMQQGQIQAAVVVELITGWLCPDRRASHPDNNAWSPS
jgi:hypothetical protein